MRIIIYRAYNKITKSERGDFMDLYDSNVQTIMNFLKDEGDIKLQSLVSIGSAIGNSKSIWSLPYGDIG